MMKQASIRILSQLKATILLLMAFSVLLFSLAIHAEQNVKAQALPSIKQQADRALEQSQGFKPEDYSTGQPTDLKKSLDEYQQKKRNTNTKNTDGFKTSDRRCR